MRKKIELVQKLPSYEQNNGPSTRWVPVLGNNNDICEHISM